MAIVLYAGADVRVDPRLDDPSWDGARRRTFLLRRDIRRPLSIDRNVWPCPEGLCDEAPLPWVPVEEVLERASRGRPRAAAPSVLLVIGCVAFSESERARFAGERGIDHEWAPDPRDRFLGYDVDDDAISGLSNCGYAEDVADELRPIWAPRLNDHGLLTSLGDAEAFREITNARVSEHAPFGVSAMWIVGETA